MTGTVLAVEKHRGERCNAELANVMPRKELAVNFHLRDVARTDLELIGARHALAVEQRVEGDCAIARLRPHQPEVSEARELLAALRRGIDRQSPRRQSVTLVAAEKAEVRGTEEGDQLVLVGRCLQRVMHAEAREAETRVGLRRLHELPEQEVLWVVGDRRGGAGSYLEDVDTLAVVIAAMEKLRLEHGLAAPQRARGAKADVVVLVVAEVRERRGQGVGHRAIFVPGALLRQMSHIGESEQVRFVRGCGSGSGTVRNSLAHFRGGRLGGRGRIWSRVQG